MTVYSPTDAPPPPRARVLTFVVADFTPFEWPDEEVWLPIIGPTAWCVGTLLHRQVVAEGKADWTVPDLARRVGLGTANGKLVQAIKRLCDYGIVTSEGADTYSIRMVWGTPRRRRSH